MTLNELHNFIFTELGVNHSYKAGSRIDNLAVKHARAIFCTIASDMGFDKWDISEHIMREYPTVNYDIRLYKSLLENDDFLSKSICESYNKIVALLRETKN